jgi:uncharacterized protein (DUF983 family)
MEFPPECDMDFQEGLEDDSPVYMVMFQISGWLVVWNIFYFPQ